MVKKLEKFTSFFMVFVMVASALLVMLTPAAATPVLSIDSLPASADEGVSTSFAGTIDGYGTGTVEGYVIDDTLNEPWIDASGGTTLITSASSGGAVATLALPFDFNFWGVEYTAGSTIWVASNAVMDFGCGDHFNYYNYNIPSTSSSSPNNAAYVYQDSMRIRSSSSSYVSYVVGTATVSETNDPGKLGHAYLAIEWHNMYYSSTSSNPGTMEIVLWDDSDIDMRYKDVSFYYTSHSKGRSTTVGIENAAGTAAAKYCYNPSSPGPISNGDNIRYTFNEAGGTTYEWWIDSVKVASGVVSSEPFTPTVSHTFPDGPAIGTLMLRVLVDDVLVGQTSRTVQVDNVAPLVYGDGTYADNYAGDTHGYARSVYLGDWIYFHGHISDVAADTPADWATQQWVEVTPGSEGVEWEITPYTGPYQPNWEYNWEVKFLRPGIYTVTVYVEDKDGGIGSGSDQRAPRYCVAMEHPRWTWSGAGHGLEVLDAAVKPVEVQAGGMTLAYLDVTHNHPDPDVQVPLNKEDFQTLLPEGWELLRIYGPEWINGGSTESLVAAISIPPGTPVGDYGLFVESLPYTVMNHWHEIGGGVWWCGDDATSAYGQYYADTLVYENMMVDAQYLKLDHAIVSDSASGGCVLIDDGTGWDLLTPLDGYVGEAFALGRALDLPYVVDGPGFQYTYSGVDYFDISAYAGQQVDIIMMFASWSSSGYRGWEIYDLSIVDHTGTNVFFDDFADATNWDTDDKYGVTDYDMDDSGDCVDYWIDIVDPANDLTIDEDYPDRFETIAYDFTFYGELFHSLDVTSKGYTIMDIASAYNMVVDPYILPQSYVYTKGVIAPFWAYDLSPGHGSYERGDVYGKLMDTTGDGNDNQLVVTWNDCQFGYSSSNTATFQMILDNTDNTIRFNYQHLAGTPTKTCVGLNQGDGARYELYYWGYYSTQIGTRPTDCTTILYTPGAVVKTSGWEIVPVVDGMMTETPYGDYSNTWDTYLTQLVEVPLGGDYATLEFDHMYWVWGGDMLFVEISDDNGANWDQVEMYGYYDVTETPGYPTSTVHAYIDISDYLGEDILVRFHLDADTSGVHDGWYIDNVEINTYEQDVIGIESASDPRLAITVSVVDKMKGNELAYYRHTQNAIREIVTLDLNLEDGMTDDGSLDAALDAYTSGDTQAAHSIACAANAHGESYGYWTHEGGYSYFFNPGKNGNGMAGLTGKEATD